MKLAEDGPGGYFITGFFFNYSGDFVARVVGKIELGYEVGKGKTTELGIEGLGYSDATLKIVPTSKGVGILLS